MSNAIANPKFPALAEPVKIGDIEVRNRAFMASLTRGRSGPLPYDSSEPFSAYKAGAKTQSIPNEDNLLYYTQRAKGGVGLILTEGTLISPQGSEWPKAPGIWSEAHVEAWKKIVDSVHKEGAKIVLQNWHVGRIAHPEQQEAINSGKPVYSASAVAARGGKFREIGNKPHAVPTAVEDPQEIIDDYKKAATFAKAAGFDGIEVHSANGYLINQFLDAGSNKRTDKWGGSIENRARFGLEVVKAHIEVWGSQKVGIKLNPCGGYNDVGEPLEDQIALFTYYIGELNKLDLAYIQLVKYLPAMDPEIDGKKRATQHDVFKTYIPLISNPKTSVLVNGGFDGASAQEILSSKEADAVVFGFPWIANPDVYERVQLGIEFANPDFGTLYAGKPEAEGGNAAGYADYPFSPETPSGKKESASKL